MKILVTGTAGFIGFHVSRKLIFAGHEVLGIDNLNAYYDITLKQSRLQQLQPLRGFHFQELDISNREDMARLFHDFRPERVVHLAAQAGVRYSLENPYSYVDTNLVGFIHILEGCRQNRVPHLVYASSSSVYGSNTKIPFSVHDNVDHPISLYAATKKANELMAHTYSHLFGLPTTGLRFFTVYGPWGRPDMALFLFTQAILEDRPINVFNYGNMKRDFTYIDDVVEGTVRTLDKIPQPDPNWSTDAPLPGSSQAPYRVYNIGKNQPVDLMRFIEVLEDCWGKKAQKNLLPMQPGDVPNTYADVNDLIQDVGYKPTTPIEVGVARFVEWYREYYRV